MDIDFIVQDSYALTRKDWKLVTNLEEAGHAFAEAVTQNFKPQGVEKVAEPEDADNESSSDDGGDEDELRVPEMDDAHSSSEEVDPEVCCLALLNCVKG